jgi:hypothetical protein
VLIQAAQVIPDIGGVTDGVHLTAGVAGGDQFDHHPGVGELACAAGMPQPGQDRQAHRPGQKRHHHNHTGDHPAVAEPDRLGPLGGAVVVPEHPEHLAARALEQGVVDDDRDRGPGR